MGKPGDKRHEPVREQASEQEQECEKEHERLADYYQHVSGRLSDRMKSYMQSWTIAGSAILVGVVVGLKDVCLQEGELTGQGVLLGLSPVVFLFWYLVTSWFWAAFSAHRSYLSQLEKKLRASTGSEYPSYYSEHRLLWFGGTAEGKMALATAVVGLIVYLIMVSAASFYLVHAVNWWASPIIALYIGGAMYSRRVAKAFIRGSTE